MPKIVIVLDDQVYQDIKDLKYPTIVEKAIANGTVLPKGHGRLIDTDAIWGIYHSNDYDFYEALDDAPTIIEADKESEVQK